MRKPSRMMPPASTSETTEGCWLMLAFLGVVFGVIAYQMPFALVPIGAIALASLVISDYENRRLAKLAAERQGESICTFARSFDCRAVDTWVIRAVFEGLQPYCGFGHGTLQLRAADDLNRDLRIDSEDVADLLLEASERAGRSLDDYEGNPFYHRMDTVSDLVMFLVNQPKRHAA